MTTPAELVVLYTALDGDELEHIQRLLGSWGVLADLSFSDLLLVAPVSDKKKGDVIVLGQMRPTTSATLLAADLVGQISPKDRWPMVVTALEQGIPDAGIARLPEPTQLRAGARSASTPMETGEIPVVPEAAHLECVPVSYGGSVIAALVRVTSLDGRRRGGRLERTYRDLYHRLATMVSAGCYPFSGEDVTGEDAPRVGDGLVMVDAEGRVVYCSPNAINALHRMGVSSAAEGRRLAELGVEETAVDRALATGRPVIEEIERRPDVIVLAHCTPLLDAGTVTGAIVLLRDVTDLRRLDRLLLSKDAAIREVHHRVKNNLQTISSLLSLQARRLEPGEGRDALHEAERRVRSIAVVHEILAREPGDQVPFDDIVASLVRMAEESVVSGRDVTIRVVGDLGEVAAEVATSLAVVLAELLQNAAEHAFVTDPEADDKEKAAQPGRVEVVLANDGTTISIQVSDDGIGLPDGFEIEKTNSLGLSIVRGLVNSQLGGEISMQSTNGTVVSIKVPVDGGQG